jgi:hypothetical protein
MKKLLAASLFFLSSGALANSLLDTNYNVRGYDEKGNKVRCEGLREGESCEVVSTEFTGKCSDQGHRVLYCSDCTALCSEPVN